MDFYELQRHFTTPTQHIFGEAIDDVPLSEVTALSRSERGRLDSPVLRKGRLWDMQWYDDRNCEPSLTTIDAKWYSDIWQRCEYGFYPAGRCGEHLVCDSIEACVAYAEYLKTATRED